MEKKNILTEPENRFCPICGDKVKIGSKLHRCKKSKLKQLEVENELKDVCNEEERTYGDVISEFDELFNNHTYYNDE